MRLGIVPYSNCTPLVHGIACEIFKAPPSKLAQMAEPEDIIMAPIVTAFLDPAWHLLEGVGIGSFGEVDTVKLFYKNENITPQNIKTIYLDSDSLTSLNLIKILLQYRFERNLAEIEWTQNKQTETEGKLLIGDKTWSEPSSHGLDLGVCWTEWTKLPFVYACWMTKSAAVGKEWKPKLVQQARHNLKDLETISQDAALLKYWRKLVYQLGAPQKQGIALFQKYWGELNHQKVTPLQWI